ncbi:MAG: M28 family peptidase [Bacteroidia bacterium]
MKKHLYLFLLPFLCVLSCQSQNVTDGVIDDTPFLNEKLTTINLKNHIATLASDKFEGRETGTKGEQLSYDYITSQFKEIGLKPKGENGYLQPFPFTKETVIGEKTSLKLNEKKFKPGEDFFPLPYSANATVTGDVVNVKYGITAPTLDYDDYRNRDVKGKIVMMELSSPDGSTPHSKYAEFADVRTKIEKAIEKGALAVIFVNSDKDTEDPKAEYKNKITPSSVPVVFAKSMAYKLLMDGTKPKAEISVELKKVEATGHNVIGYLDNNAAATIVIGAHFDHLGYGDDGSLYRGEPAIHNGADDNASGSAALIELARTLKNSTDKSNNYLFIAFSGEEKGLLGSNYFVKHPTIDLKTVNYMMNMDMVGRLKKDERTLQVLGAGTSPAWKEVIEKINIDSVKIKESESGVGPSDHTSFYLSDIPVLHFFTGSHPDYHKPSDDEDKINYQGEISVMKIILSIIHQLNGKEKLAFTKTKDSDNSETPRFKVTLGVVPDYAFEGEGMRIDGVSDGKPASKAGLKAGDIVIQLGENKVLDMMSYMKALGKFEKGDTATVKVKRGNETVDAQVTF